MAEEARESAMIDIEVIHPINHDHVEYGRGLHTLRRELALLFLGLAEERSGFDEKGNWTTKKIPIARVYQPETPRAPARGSVTTFTRSGQRLG